MSDLNWTVPTAAAVETDYEELNVRKGTPYKVGEA